MDYDLNTPPYVYGSEMDDLISLISDDFSYCKPISDPLPVCREPVDVFPYEAYADSRPTGENLSAIKTLSECSFGDDLSAFDKQKIESVRARAYQLLGIKDPHFDVYQDDSREQYKCVKRKRTSSDETVVCRKVKKGRVVIPFALYPPLYPPFRSTYELPGVSGGSVYAPGPGAATESSFDIPVVPAPTMGWSCVTPYDHSNTTGVDRRQSCKQVAGGKYPTLTACVERCTVDNVNYETAAREAAAAAAFYAAAATYHATAASVIPSVVVPDVVVNNACVERPDGTCTPMFPLLCSERIYEDGSSVLNCVNAEHSISSSSGGSTMSGVSEISSGTIAEMVDQIDLELGAAFDLESLSDSTNSSDESSVYSSMVMPTISEMPAVYWPSAPYPSIPIEKPNPFLIPTVPTPLNMPSVYVSDSTPCLGTSDTNCVNGPVLNPASFQPGYIPPAPTNPAYIPSVPALVPSAPYEFVSLDPVNPIPYESVIPSAPYESVCEKPELTTSPSYAHCSNMSTSLSGFALPFDSIEFQDANTINSGMTHLYSYEDPFLEESNNVIFNTTETDEESAVSSDEEETILSPCEEAWSVESTYSDTDCSEGDIFSLLPKTPVLKDECECFDKCKRIQNYMRENGCEGIITCRKRPKPKDPKSDGSKCYAKAVASCGS